MNRTVKNYEEGELTEEGFSGEIRNKKRGSASYERGAGSSGYYAPCIKRNEVR